jgi:uncharacterized delta-60 repeat protein
MMTFRPTRSRKPHPDSRPHRKVVRSPHLEPLEGRTLLSGAGSLDPTFNGNGIQTSNLLTAANATAVQGDGRMVVVGDGIVTNGKTHYRAIGVTRLNADGSLDTGFGSAGLVTILEGNQATGLAVTLQSDGKILVSGTAWTGKNFGLDSEYVVARLNPNGSLDSTFASNGQFVWNPTKGDEQARAMTVLADGSIVVGGHASPFTGGFSPDTYTAFKLTSAGKLVTSFGTNGEFRYDFGGQGGSIGSMAIAPRGDVILAGDAVNASGHRSGAILALTPSGKLDPTFNTTGVLVVAPPVGDNYLSFGDVAIQNGKILVAGTTGAEGAIVARFSVSGALDTSFGSGGSFTTLAASGFCLALESDGSIVVGGWYIYQTIMNPDGSTTTHSEMVVSHLTSDGAIDTSFGSLGTGFTYVQIGLDSGIGDLAIGPGGSIYACGSGTDSQSNREPTFIRLTAPTL